MVTLKEGVDGPGTLGSCSHQRVPQHGYRSMFPGRSVCDGHAINIVGVMSWGPWKASIVYYCNWYPTACLHNILLYRIPSVGKVTDEQLPVLQTLLVQKFFGDVIVCRPVRHCAPSSVMLM